MPMTACPQPPFSSMRLVPEQAHGVDLELASRADEALFAGWLGAVAFWEGAMTDHWKKQHSIALLAIVIGIVLLGLLLPNSVRLWGWLGTLALFAAFTTVAGRGITGLWRGALIDERNKMSLARLQLVVWTLVVLSGYLTAALGNLTGGHANPLAIAIPGDMWLLMGISTTSLVASPLLKGNKTSSQPEPRETARTLDLLASQGTDKSKVETQGVLVVNTTPGQAQWADLFKGEETGNAGLLDIAKVQMFYFSLVVVLAYAIALGTVMRQGAFPLVAFPDLDAGMVALLGISHAGYLTSKAVPHSTTT
jgi:hypothetical protein